MLHEGNEDQGKSGKRGKLLLRCSTTYIPVGDSGRSSLMRSYSYAFADDRPALFAGFPLIFVPFMQHAGSPPVNRV